LGNFQEAGHGPKRLCARPVFQIARVGRGSLGVEDVGAGRIAGALGLLPLLKEQLSLARRPSQAGRKNEECEPAKLHKSTDDGPRADVYKQLSANGR